MCKYSLLSFFVKCLRHCGLLTTVPGVKSNDFVISRLPTEFSEVSKETFGNNYVNPFTLKFFLLELRPLK